MRATTGDQAEAIGKGFRDFLPDVGKHHMNTRRQVADTGGMSKTRESRREFWRQFMAQQQQSGMSVRAFCRQRGTSEHSFYQWRKRLASQLPVKFALVEMNCNSPTKALPIEVLLTSGERLRIMSGCDAATLRTVVEVLREPR